MVSFSVVVSSYNYRAYVGEAVDSALTQTHPALEIVVVDDGSTDGSAEILAQLYSGNARVRIIQQPNRGQLAAFAAGVREARGDIVAFLDADDVWEPRYLERIAAVYDSHPAVDFVFTDMQLFGRASGLYSELFPCEKRTRDIGLNVLTTAFHSDRPWFGTATSALSLKRDLARKLLDLPPDYFLEWHTNADVCIVRGADILGAHKYYIGEPLARYRAHGTNAWLLGDASPGFRHRMRIEQILSVYRARMHIGPHWLRHAKAEFKTKAAPTRAELKRYLHLLSLSDLPLLKRLEHSLSMRRYYSRTKKQQPSANASTAPGISPSHQS